MAHHARLVATGCHVPPIEVPNAAIHARFAARFPEFVAKMERSTGIRTRWHAPEDAVTSDLALAASLEALARAEVDPADLDLVVLATDTPDYVTPATSVVLQHKLGAKRAGTFDVGCACASFPTGIAAAAGIMATNRAIRNVLVVGAYLMHKLADPDDPMSFFYGDGAGAAVLQPGSAPGFLGAAFAADGSFHRYWGIFAGGTFEPTTAASLAAGRARVQVRDRYPNDINDAGWPRLVRKLAADVGFAVGDVDFIVFTQVRRDSIEHVMADLGLPLERTHMVMDKWGYTGSACIPMALHDALEQRRVAPGSLVVLLGSGVGYNQAAVALRV
jgi:3-oxoacyl-[acyl-carrier-protein] synthase-3